MVSSCFVYVSSVRSSPRRQLTTPKLHLYTGTAIDPRVCIIFFAHNSVPKTNLNLFKHSLFNFSFSFLCCISWLSSIPSYLFAFVGSISLMFSYVLLTCFFPLEPTIFFKHVLAHFSSPDFMLMCFIIAFAIHISFSKLSSILPSSFQSSMYNKWFIFLSVLCTRYPQSALFSSFVNAIRAIQNVMVKDSPPGILLFVSELVVTVLLPVLFLAEASFSVSLLMFCKI